MRTKPLTTHGDDESCPNCGDATEKTGNPTPGNTPERRCPSCGWLNWYGRPPETGPPYTCEEHRLASLMNTLY
jgi:predicted RNA-binding Zn-ribbon protein involved in translation (DUF1610 family)